MPFDGSGNYVPPSAPAFPAVSGTSIVAAYYNQVINDIVTALNNCLTRDGQGKPSASLNFNGQTVTNVGGITCTGVTDTGPLSAASLSVSGNSALTGTLSVTGAVSFGAPLTTNYGGTGVDAHLAANGALLIGNGAGFALATITAGAGISVTNSAGGITIAATGGGGAGTTSFPLTISNAGTGAASGSTFDGSAAKTISWNSIGAKPNTPQVQGNVSAATITPTFSNDLVTATALAVNVTLANPTGTALDGYGIAIRLKDNGVARTIAYGTQYRAVGVSLPTTTVAGKNLYLGCIWNAADTKFDVVAVNQE